MMNDVLMNKSIESVKKFRDKECCAKFMEEHANDISLLWKDAGGIPILDSYDDEEIGSSFEYDEVPYTTIQLTDMCGSDDYADDEHVAKFAVFLYREHCEEENVELCDTIDEAVEKYLENCEIVKEMVSEKSF